jgi:type II secretory pathway component PulK
MTKAYRDRGFVLVAILVVIILASMVALSLMLRLRAEEKAGAAGAGSEQAWAAAMSGVYQAMQVAAQSRPGSLQWQSNPEVFRQQFVGEDGADRWYFTVYTAGSAEEGGLRFGLSDEAAKLNLLDADESTLGKIPEMWPARVQALLDFLDFDDQARSEGAESEYYERLPQPYIARDTDLETLEELLLVRGFTPELFYGEDANLNFHLDPNEDDGDERFPPDNNNGVLDLGLRQYLTVSSYDLNLDKDRLPRLKLNDPSLTLFQLKLPESALHYIHMMRSNKVAFAHPAELLEAKRVFKNANGKEVEVASGIGKDELPLVLDQLTTSKQNRLPGLVNVNTASAWVLQALPGLDLSRAEAIAAARRGLTEEERQTPAWIYQQDLVDAATFRTLAPHLTARSLQFHFHALGYGVPSGRYRVLEAEIDLGDGPPRISYLRDLTRLGLPFRINTDKGPGNG